MASVIYVIVCVVVIICCVEGSLKRGVCISPYNYHCLDTNAFRHVTWWYDWGNTQYEHTHHNCTNTPHGEYVPMFWGEHMLHRDVVPHDAKHVLAFNEPNYVGQSNMSPEKVAQLWPELERKAGERKIISPALAGCSNATHCIKWFTEFFSHCRNCRVDALAVHSYSCNVDQVLNSMNSIAHKFGKNIWLTEFACASATTVEQQLDFMMKILPQLESSPIIERYSWFVNRLNRNTTFINSSTDLLERDSSELTRLGRYYDEYQYSI